MSRGMSESAGMENIKLNQLTMNESGHDLTQNEFKKYMDEANINDERGD